MSVHSKISSALTFENAWQYTRTAGHPSLITTLAARYSMHLERDIKPESEVAITIGASQARILKSTLYNEFPLYFLQY